MSDNVPVAGPSGKRLHTLRRPNPAQTAVIRRIFETYAGGAGSTGIARMLNAEGVPAPRPKGWSQTGIRTILRNPIYRGEVVWGRIKTVVSKGRSRLPETAETITGSGGRHVLFLPSGLRNSSSRIGPGLDIRGEGGYIVAAPSVHASGRRYEPEVLHALDTVPLAAMPDWLHALAIEPSNGHPAAAPAVEPRILEGQRNSQLTSLAGTMRRRGLAEPEILAALLEVNRRRCTPPLPEAEVRAIAASVARYAPADVTAPTETSTPRSEAATEQTAYTFTPAFPPDHFVSRFINYGSHCVDTAHEYLETVALVLLATATPGVRARLRQYPRGLSTALYALLIGDSTRSRKSTVAGLGLDLLADAVPEFGRLADLASPEAWLEQLADADRSRHAALWYADEIGETFDKLHHAKYLAGLRGLLLELYEGRPYRYKRTTKRTKQGKAVRDEIVLERPHLSVLGATTPAIFEIIHRP